MVKFARKSKQLFRATRSVHVVVLVRSNMCQRQPHCSGFVL